MGEKKKKKKKKRDEGAGPSGECCFDCTLSIAGCE